MVKPSFRRVLERAVVAVDDLHRVTRSSNTATDSCAELLEGGWSLLGQFTSGGRRYLVAADRGKPLSARELQAVRLAAAGFSNKAIAGRLALTTGGVGAYLASATRKLGLRSRRDLVRLCSYVAPAK